MTEELVDAFSAMQPTGFGNPAPVFCVRGVHTTEIHTMGKDGVHLRMKLAQGSDMRNAIGFRMGERMNTLPEVVEAILSLSINVWQDRRSVQCELRQIQAYMPGRAFVSECQRQADRIDGAMLDAVRLEGEQPKRIENMTLKQAEDVLADAFSEGYQGVLLGVHTLAAMKLLNVHLAVLHAQLDYAIGGTADIRGFNTLVMAPNWSKIAFKPRVIVAMDGFLSDGERAWVTEQFPDTRIIEVTDLRGQAASAAERLLPTDDALRGLYKALRQREKVDCTMNMLAAATGLDEGMILAGLMILSELHLIEYKTEPLEWRILPSGKVSLENSRFRARLMQMKDEGRKTI